MRSHRAPESSEPSEEKDLQAIAPVLTYAEMHFRPALLPSAVFKRAPEIIADTPRRIEPDCPIPVFILIKDAHRYPVALDAVVVHISYPGAVERIARFPYHKLRIDMPIWWDSINITPEYTGTVQIDVFIEIIQGRRKTLVKIDNYHDTSHTPLTTTVATSSLPGAEHWHHGDMHCHSFFTEDQIEFGAPLEVLAFAAYCMGLGWIAVTDHSYDLDNREDSLTGTDPLLLKWRLMRKKAEMLAESMAVIPGEEVSCRTQDGRNCHLLSLGSDKFIYGSGDSGERGPGTVSERSVGEAVAQCVEWGGLACAAHPFEPVSLAERLILKRGLWRPGDLDTPGLSGMQFYNGARDEGFRAGMRTWIQLLLAGKRVLAFGGSDSHGDLNRRRGIGIPLVSVRESAEHTFGSVRTVVHAPTPKTGDLLAAMHAGHVVVTDGPFIELSAFTESGRAIPGDRCRGGSLQVAAVYRSSGEFGPLSHCRLMGGNGAERRELTIAQVDPLEPMMLFEYRKTIDTAGIHYIRAECETRDGHICYTNPIWIDGVA